MSKAYVNLQFTCIICAGQRIQLFLVQSFGMPTETECNALAAGIGPDVRFFSPTTTTPYGAADRLVQCRTKDRKMCMEGGRAERQLLWFPKIQALLHQANAHPEKLVKKHVLLSCSLLEAGENHLSGAWPGF